MGEMRGLRTNTESRYFRIYRWIYSRKLDRGTCKEVFTLDWESETGALNFRNTQEFAVGSIRNQSHWGLSICLWIIAAPMVCMGQLTAQLPYQNSPWQGNPQPNGMFPAGPSAIDPYAATFRPSTAPIVTTQNPYGTVPNSGWTLGNLFGWNQPSAPIYGAPSYGNPSFSTFGNPNPFSNPQGAPTFPPSVYPNSAPGVLFPGTGVPPPSNSIWNLPNQVNPYQANPYQPNPYQTNPFQTNPFGFQQNNYAWNNWWNSTGANLNAGTNQVIRLFQGPRFRHTWLPGTAGFDGKKPNSLESNDSDVSLVFAIPNFLNSTRPLYIIPSYSQHEWDGPTVAGTDLPGSAFSGFLDSGWETNPQQTLGVELGVRVGVFSAFDAINADSIRIQGKALGRLRLTPTSTLRAGVFYLDRNRIKLLPAFGLLWMPNHDTRFDLFFPEPKLAHYVATLGNSDVWWYLTGYYGGGAWTIKQTDGTHDEIDINDIRLMLGLEFGKSDQIRQGFRLGFIEAGYAFNRELLYRVRSSSSLDLENSFVLRAGFAY